MKSIERSNPGVEIKQASPVELNHDFARLYGGELLNWGMVRVTRTYTEVEDLSDQTRVQHKVWGEMKE